MLRKVTETQASTAAWSGDSSGISTDLNRNGAITRLDMTAEVTPSATLTGANQPDGLFRLIQNMTVAGGSHTYFTLPAADPCGGGILLHYLNMIDGFWHGHPLGAITAPHRLYTPITFIFHAGSRPKDEYGRDNPFDMTAFIPSTLESRLTAVWVTSGNDVMDDIVTISSAVMRFTLHTVLGDQNELVAEMQRQDVSLPPGVVAMMPAWTAEAFSHTATASDYATERNVTTGGWLKRILMIEQDATATRAIRAQDEVTGVAIKLSRDGTIIHRAFVDRQLSLLKPASNTEADDAAADFQMYGPEGIIVIDLRAHYGLNNPWGKDYGLNLSQGSIGTGDVKLGLTITTYASGDQSLILYERALPILQGSKIS